MIEKLTIENAEDFKKLIYMLNENAPNILLALMMEFREERPDILKEILSVLSNDKSKEVKISGPFSSHIIMNEVKACETCGSCREISEDKGRES